MEARWPITVLWTGTKGEGGKEEWRLKTGANPDQGCRGPPPEKQNVMAVSAQHCTATTVLHNCCPNCGTVTKSKTMSAAPTGNNWSKRSPTFKPSSTSLLLISSGLTCGSSTISLLLILPGPAKASNFFMSLESPAHLPPLDLAWITQNGKTHFFLHPIPNKPYGSVDIKHHVHLIFFMLRAHDQIADHYGAWTLLTYT